MHGGVDVFVEYPSSVADNRAADLVMHHEVGQWVALGGGAYHLREAARRLQALSETATADTRGAESGSGASRVLDSFADLLPDPTKLAKIHPDLVERGTRAPRGAGKRAARARKVPRKRSTGRR